MNNTFRSLLVVTFATTCIPLLSLHAQQELATKANSLQAFSPTPASASSLDTLTNSLPSSLPVSLPLNPTNAPSATPTPVAIPTSESLSSNSLTSPLPPSISPAQALSSSPTSSSANSTPKHLTSLTQLLSSNSVTSQLPPATAHTSSSLPALESNLDALPASKNNPQVPSSKTTPDLSDLDPEALPPSLKAALSHLPPSKNASHLPPSKNTANLDSDLDLDALPPSSLSHLPPSTLQPPTPKKNGNEKITIQFPHTSILEVLSLYEKLTGKHIIRDSNLAGPELSIMVADPVSKKDAVGLIESSMLLNGYILVPVDEKTIKVLGPSRPPRSEGLPLYLEESELPTDGDQLVSFYQPLHFLSPNEAINVIQGVVQLNPFGSLVAVPNTSSIVITDKTPIIRKALALLEVIDHEPSEIITEFITLQRADPEKMVETLNQIVGQEGNKPSTPSKPSQPPGANGAITQGNEENRILSGKVQFIPDKRTSRILLITRTENYRYLRELISKLDQAVHFEEPLVRPLNYMSTTDVFPVLVDMLKNKDDESKTTGTNAQTPQNPIKGGSGGAGGSQDSANAGGNKADRLSESAQLPPPQSAIIGSTSIIGDATANSIIVYGPPETKAKASQIINLLDQRPKQVYLAAVIGELRLNNDMDYGSSWLVHFNGFNTLANGITSLQAIPANPVEALRNGLGGLTCFGAIGGNVNVFADLLEQTGRFRTISRPVVYTSNNRKATILSGQRIPYNSQTLSSVIGTASNNQPANSVTSNITYQDVLLKLEVIPLINSDKEVNLVIAQQNQSVAPTATAIASTNGIQAPVINTQELTTSVRVPNGSTIVLGGLIKDDKDSEERGIPYINKIPILGPLLGGHTHKSRTRTELIVMIQPTVVDSNASMERASLRQGASTELGKRGKALEKKLMPIPTPTPCKKKFQFMELPKIDNF